MVSIERVWSELARIITGKNASKVLSRMNDDGILAAIIGYPLHSEVLIWLVEYPRTSKQDLL